MDDDTVGLLVIGGGPAGLHAARGYREAGGAGAVRIVTADDRAPYTRPPLSKDFLRGETGEADLPMQDDDAYRDYEIDVTVSRSVASVRPDAREAVTDGGARINFENCVLATGSEPVRPPLSGVEHPDVRVLRSLDSAVGLRTAADAVDSAVVVGAGFIGCEAAVSLARRGVRTTVICTEAAPQVSRLGDAAGQRIAGWLAAEGVRVLARRSLQSVHGGHRAVLDTGEAVDTGLVLLATGVRPRCGLAEAAGIETASGRVRTDQHMRTSAPSVLAAGDVALAHNPTAGRALPVEHWGEALAMGDVAGRTAAGQDARWDAVPGFWSVIGDRVIKYAAWGDGFDEARLVEHDDDAFTVWYGLRGTLVGVLTHEADEDYERGGELVAAGAALHRR